MSWYDYATTLNQATGALALRLRLALGAAGAAAACGWAAAGAATAWALGAALQPHAVVAVGVTGLVDSLIFNLVSFRFRSVAVQY